VLNIEVLSMVWEVEEQGETGSKNTLALPVPQWIS
jgi:hypothetical protein